MWYHDRSAEVYAGVDKLKSLHFSVPFVDRTHFSVIIISVYSIS